MAPSKKKIQIAKEKEHSEKHFDKALATSAPNVVTGSFDLQKVVAFIFANLSCLLQKAIGRGQPFMKAVN